MKRIGSLLGWVALSSLALPAPAAELSVVSVEVTQGIQTPTNSVPLVAGRSTAVRARIGLTGANTVTGVVGSLRLTTASGSLTLTPLGGTSFTVVKSPKRDSPNEYLSFEVPGSFSPPVAPALVQFKVEISSPTDTTPADNSLTVSLPFHARATPAIYFTRIAYLPISSTPAAWSLVKPLVGDAMVRGIFPFNDNAPDLYRENSPYATMSFNVDTGTANIIDYPNDRDVLLSNLESARQLTVTAGIGTSARTFLYGWVPGNPITSNGWSTTCGNVGFGNTDTLRYQRTFAHELGHMLGLDPHNKRKLDEVGWDLGARLFQNPIGNGVSTTVARTKPTSFYDIMVAGKVTSEAWVDTQTFDYFLTHDIFWDFDFTDPAPAGLPGGEEGFSQRVLSIQGTFSEDGSQLLTLEPVFRFPWPSQPSAAVAGGRYRVEVKGENATIVEKTFDALLGHDGEDQDPPVQIRGFFAVMVAFDGEVQSLRITDSANLLEFATLVRSPTPPSVTILSPDPSSTLGDETTVDWEVADVDPGTDLTTFRYQVAYSPDGGTSFFPIGVDLAVTELTFDSKLLPATAGVGLIRVFASDGLNTAFADVGSLSSAGPRTPPFLRGDVDSDMDVGLTDAVVVLNHLFSAGPDIPCLAAADTNLQGGINLSSAIYILQFSFLGGPPPPDPHPACGASQVPSDLELGCEAPCPP